MKSLADAFVIAVVHIAVREDNGAEADRDVAAIEAIANRLATATEAELNAVSDAASRALAEEREGLARVEFIDIYEEFLHYLFGEC